DHPCRRADRQPRHRSQPGDHGHPHRSQSQQGHHGDHGHPRAGHGGLRPAHRPLQGWPDRNRRAQPEGRLMFAETLLLAIRAVRRNALRSTLTALGIIIGVAAVIGLVTIGNGTQQSVVAGISKLGSNLLSVRPGAPGGPPGGARSTAKAFSAADAEAIAAQIGGVRAVAPVASTKTVAVAGNTNWNTTLVGTDDDYFQAGSWTIASGRVFTDSETRAGSAVCVIGQTARQHLFGASDPVGQAIRLEKMPCTIIGMLEAKGAGAFGMDQDDIIVVPLRTFQRRIAG